MRFLSFFSLAAPLFVSAAPLWPRKVTDSEILVLTFADVLEQLESKFYEQALSKFKEQDFVTAGFSSSALPVQQFTTIQGDEATHSKALRKLLQSFGKSPVDSCQFNFDAALKDVKTMAATARVVENVGIGAYLGGATLIQDPLLLTAAGSILTIEARHQSVLNILNNGSPIPSAFDIALTPSEVLGIAGPFISGCDLGIPSNVPLQITNQGTPAPGTQLEFKASTLNGTLDENTLFCQMLLGGAVASITLPFKKCVVPQGINGPVAIWVTTDNQPLINDIRDRAKTQIVAGPTMAFIDTQPDSLSKAVLSCSSSGTTSTTGMMDNSISMESGTSKDNSTDSSSSKLSTSDSSMNSTSTDSSMSCGDMACSNSMSPVLSSSSSSSSSSSDSSSSSSDSSDITGDLGDGTGDSNVDLGGSGDSSTTSATATSTDTSTSTATTAASSTSTETITPDQANSLLSQLSSSTSTPAPTSTGS